MEFVFKMLFGTYEWYFMIFSYMVTDAIITYYFFASIEVLLECLTLVVKTWVNQLGFKSFEESYNQTYVSTQIWLFNSLCSTLAWTIYWKITWDRLYKLNRLCWFDMSNWYEIYLISVFSIVHSFNNGEACNEMYKCFNTSFPCFLQKKMWKW